MADLIILTDSDMAAQAAGILKKGSTSVEIPNGRLLIKAHGDTLLDMEVPTGKKWTIWLGVTIKEEDR